MKTLIFALSILLLSTSCTQDKTGFVDITGLVKEYSEMKETQDIFTVKTNSFNNKRDSISRAYQLEDQNFRIKAAKMNQAKAQEEYQVLQQKAQLLSQQLQAEQQAIQQEGQEKIDTLVKKIKLFVNDYGERNGYTYILGKNDSGSILYGKDDKDITKAILEELNAAYEN
jgi:outer membrane protein